MIDKEYLFQVILNLGQCLQAARIYPDHHNRFQAPLSRLHARILRTTAALGTLHIGVLGDQFIIGNTPYLDMDKMFPRKLLRELRDRGIEKISIRDGLTYGELKQFILFLADAAEQPGDRKWECISYGTIQTFEDAAGMSGLAYTLPRNHILYGATNVLKDVLSSLTKGKGSASLKDGREIVANVMKGLHQDDFLISRLLRLQSHDDYTVTHSLNVCAMVLAQAMRIGVPDGTIHELGLAAMLHDVGKEMIPLEILQKPGKISPEEFQRIAEHPVTGAALLRKIDCGSELPMIVCFEHHVKYNFTGYPKISYGGPLNIASYMTQIADVYDALRTNRPYRRSLDVETAMEIMRDGRGKEFEPALFDNFIESLVLAESSEDPTEGLTRTADESAVPSSSPAPVN
ncbi:MAG: HD domain-containing protein [Deltaproteobacteria bacterium]|nr:HD domain-containing protein [Deltaproteobacteria bacterium]